MDEITEVQEIQGRAKGGKARQAKMSKEQRSALASEAAKRRWAKKKEVIVVPEGSIPDDLDIQSEGTISVIPEKPIIEPVSLPTPPPKPKRRKSIPKPFGAASSYAEKRLAEAIKERAEAASKWAMLNAEIPGLVNIIRALGGQLPVNSQELIPEAPVGYDINTVMSDNPIPPMTQTPNLPTMPQINKGGGGAIAVLEDDQDEDMFLRDSPVSTGKWA